MSLLPSRWALGKVFVCLAGFTCLFPVASTARDNSGADLPEVVTIRKDVREVQVIFTASDESKQPVEGLTREEISLLQDGEAVSAISAFRFDRNLPLQLVLLVDTSDSMQAGFKQEQRAAAEFLGRIIRPGFDSSAVLEFAAQVTVRDQGSLESAVGNQPKTIAVQTALYDALLTATRSMTVPDPSATLSRRAIILLSDGEDNFSLHSLQEAIASAERAGIAVYSISAHGPGRQAGGDEVLRGLAADTGGHAFVLRSYADAGGVFQQIEQELRSQYLVAFTPSSNGLCGHHRLEIVPRDRKLQVRSREGYFNCGP